MATIVFDVNETLLDLSGLDEPFGSAFGDRAGEVKRVWFARLLHTSAVMTILGQFEDFGTVGQAVLTDLGDRLGLEVSADDVTRIVGTMRELEPYPDVVPGLTALGDAGAGLVALTNSGQATAEAQLAHAGIAAMFDRIISVEGAGRFKPDRAVYDHCRDTLGITTDQLTLVATHDWDCAGALAAGWKAGFVQRPGQAYNPLFDSPTYAAGDLVSLTRTIIERLQP